MQSLPRSHALRRAFGFVLVVALTATACAGGDSADPTIPPVVTSDALFVTTTTDATPMPESPSTTESTTPPDATGSPSTTADVASPTTTSPVARPTDAETRAVVDGLVASWTAFNEIKLDPFNDEKLQAVADTHRGPALDSVVTLIENLRISGRRSMTNVAVPAEVVPFPDSVQIRGGTATVEYCWINSNVLVEVGGNDDGSDRIIDDSVAASHDREMFDLLDGRWVKVGGQVVATDDGASCEVFR